MYWPITHKQSMAKCQFAVGQLPKYSFIMKKTFSDAFNEHIARTGETVTEIAKRSGVPKDALYSLRRGKTRNMAVDDAIRVAAAFGETVEEFMGLTPPQIRDELLEEIAHLTPSERAVLQASLSALRGQKDADSANTEPEKAPHLAKDKR
jgi:transcriptional regulator with XRE-family HTH domain